MSRLFIFLVKSFSGEALQYHRKNTGFGGKRIWSHKDLGFEFNFFTLTNVNISGKCFKLIGGYFSLALQTLLDILE